MKDYKWISGVVHTSDVSKFLNNHNFQLDTLSIVHIAYHNMLVTFKGREKELV